jgi:hypothetical protein
MLAGNLRTTMSSSPATRWSHRGRRSSAGPVLHIHFRSHRAFQCCHQLDLHVRSSSRRTSRACYCMAGGAWRRSWQHRITSLSTSRPSLAAIEKVWFGLRSPAGVSHAAAQQNSKLRWLRWLRALAIVCTWTKRSPVSGDLLLSLAALTGTAPRARASLNEAQHGCGATPAAITRCPSIRAIPHCGPRPFSCTRTSTALVHPHGDDRLLTFGFGGSERSRRW